MPFTAPSRFTGLSLYAVLNIDATATPDAIQRAYRRAALKYHPDHNHSQYANEEFAYLAHAYDTLSNAATRAVYDRTGEHDAVTASSAFEGSEGSAMEYWRSVFPRVSAADIESFRASYVGGAEEVADVKAAYGRYEGDVQSVLDSIPFAEADSVPRLCELLNRHCGARISATQQARLAKKAERWQRREQAEFEQLAVAGSADEQAVVQAAGDMTQLVALLARRKEDSQARQQQWLDQLADKYGARKGKRQASSRTAASGTRSAASKAQHSTTAAKGRAGKRGTTAAEGAAEEKEEETKQQGEEAEEAGDEDGDGDEPSEEEFQRIQVEMLKRREANRASAATSSTSSTRGRSGAQPDKKRKKTNK